VKHLVIGGARSGKSRFAESLAQKSGLEVVYIATAHAGDAEMAHRIEWHRSERPVGWLAIEEPLELTAALQEVSSSSRCVIVDCLTLWLTNLQGLSEVDQALRIEVLCGVLPGLAGMTVLVSNELGLGVVPANGLARAFRDMSGRLHQRLAALVDTVDLVVAGLPLRLSGRISEDHSMLEVTMGETGGGEIHRVRFAVVTGVPPMATLPKAFRERLLEEGVDLDTLARRSWGTGERPLLELESPRGTLRIALVR